MLQKDERIRQLEEQLRSQQQQLHTERIRCALSTFVPILLWLKPGSMIVLKPKGIRAVREYV